MRYSLGYTLFYVLTLVPASIAGVWLAIKYLKIEKRWQFAAAWLILFTTRSVLAYGVPDQSNIINAIATCGFFVIQIVFQIVWGTCRMYQRVLFFVIHVVSEALSELLLNVVFTLVYGDMSLFFSGQPQYLLPIAVGRLIALTLSVAEMTVFYNYVWLRLNRRSSEQAISPILLFLCSQWLCIGCLITFTSQENTSPAAVTISAVLVAVSVAGDILLLRTVGQLEKSYRTEQTLVLAEEQMKAQEQQYQTLQERLAQTRRMREDVHNHLQGLRALVEQDQTETALNQLGGLGSQLFTGQEYCRNPIVNAVTATQAEQCRQTGIDFQSDLQLPETLPIDGVDLCSLFSNLLQNAREACGRSGQAEPVIRLTGSVVRGECLVRLTNSKNPATSPEARRWRTEKQQGADHGIGTGVIADVLARCCGDIAYQDEGDTMQIVVSLGRAEVPVIAGG